MHTGISFHELARRAKVHVNTIRKICEPDFVIKSDIVKAIVFYTEGLVSANELCGLPRDFGIKKEDPPKKPRKKKQASPRSKKAG